MIISYVILGAVIVILATWERSPFRIYWKSESRRAFVRTGLGGSKAVVGGGAFIIPLIQKIQWVDLGETKLTVSRKGKQSIITKDLLRADMEAEFYIRVKADADSVKQAATALGRRADNSETLKDFLEPKLLDVLQTIASQMKLKEIHENRGQYTEKVKDILNGDFQWKGLELTTVSLCSLDQTPIDFYNADNIFDSEGLLAIKDQTEKRKKELNEVEQEQAFLIQQKNVEVRKRFLNMEKERAFAEQDAHKDIEAQKEESERELTQFRLMERRQSEETRILHDQGIKEKEIEKERILEEQRIAKELAVQLAEMKKIQDIEQTRIMSDTNIQSCAIKREIALLADKQKREEVTLEIDKAVEVLRIAQEKYLEESRIHKERDLEMAKIQKQTQVEEERINRDQEVKVAAVRRETELILEKEKQELADIQRINAQDVAKLANQAIVTLQGKAITLAQSEVVKATLQQEVAEQEVQTARVRSQMERQKMATLLRAEEDAARQKIEKTMAVDLSVYEIDRLAEARFHAADNEAQAIERAAVATQKEGIAKAAAERAIIEARNLITEHILKNENKRILIGELANIARELMKPAEKIDSIKVIQVSGLGEVSSQARAAGSGDETLLSSSGAQSAIGTIINGILQVGAFKPVFRELLRMEEGDELEAKRVHKVINEIFPGLLEQAGKDLRKESVRQEGEKAERTEKS